MNDLLPISEGRRVCNTTKKGRKPCLEKVGLYKIGKTLGRGNFATVRLAVHEVANVKVALKMVDTRLLDSENLGKIEREIQILKQLNHPFVVRLFEVIRTDNFIYIITEYVRNGELFDLLMDCGRQPEADARIIFQQVVAAVSYLHRNGIVHRDLKAENLLIDKKGRIKLIDFGFSNWQQPGILLNTWCGSPPYAAPELLLAQEYDGRMSDIWSLGVILYILVTGGFPFPGDSVDKLKRAVLGGDRSLRIPFWVSVECADLIRKMLVISPAKRLQLPGIINHRWFMSKEMSDELRSLFLQVGINVPSKEITTNSIDVLANLSLAKPLIASTQSFNSISVGQEIKLDPTIAFHMQQHTGWTLDQINEEVVFRNFESPIFATYELLAAKLADLRAEEMELSTLTTNVVSPAVASLQHQKVRRGSRGSILSGRANIDDDLAQTTTVIPVHHLAKLSLSVANDESDESSASDDREFAASQTAGGTSGSTRRRRYRHNKLPGVYNQQQQTEGSLAANKSSAASPPINPFPFMPVNPLLNAVAQKFTVDALARAAATAALLQIQQQQLVGTTSNNSGATASIQLGTGLQNLPFVTALTIGGINCGGVQPNQERRASANEAIFGINYAQHFLAAYSTMFGGTVGGTRDERCTSSLAGGTASPTMMQQQQAGGGTYSPRSSWGRNVEDDADRRSTEYFGSQRGSGKRNTFHCGSGGLTSGLPITTSSLSSQRHIRSGPYPKQQGANERRSSTTERRSSWAATTVTPQTASAGLCITQQQHAQLEAIYRQSIAAAVSNVSTDPNSSSTNVPNLQFEFQKLCASQGAVATGKQSADMHFTTTPSSASQNQSDFVKPTPTISIIDENSQLIIPPPTSPLPNSVNNPLFNINFLPSQQSSSSKEIPTGFTTDFMIPSRRPEQALNRLASFAQGRGILYECQPGKENGSFIARMAFPNLTNSNRTRHSYPIIVEISLSSNLSLSSKQYKPASVDDDPMRGVEDSLNARILLISEERSNPTEKNLTEFNEVCSELIQVLQA